MRLSMQRQAFLSPQVFQLETERVFARSWVCVGHSDEFSMAETDLPVYRTVSLGAYQLLIVRDEHGRFRAFHNVCRHRGARLLDQTSGALDNHRITCPYHAWTYDTRGRLIGCPNMAGDPAFSREAFGLQCVACVNWSGLVMIHLHGRDEDFESAYQPIISRLQNWKLNSLKIGARLEYQVRANWKLLFQNFSECYHCPTVHPELNRMTPYKSASNDLLEGPILGGPMQLADGVETVSSDGMRIARPFASLNECQRRAVYYYTIFPNLFISAHPDYVLVHRLEREDIANTSVQCFFLVEPQVTSAELARAVAQWDVINRQDWQVCEWTQRGIESPAHQPGPYSPLESMVYAFDAHYRSVMG